ncbi:uncharacterized protein LOC129739563 [Uranotaenia lowii]|uniref:uncharacterized protein LOC129739563 n=1 Tax=Uranotaenia lowii TaxID=190385 RepID=UPI002479015A|nr:uncharacterized protein LOC129739563 [Uranotaenia lowii]
MAVGVVRSPFSMTRNCHYFFLCRADAKVHPHRKLPEGRRPKKDHPEKGSAHASATQGLRKFPKGKVPKSTKRHHRPKITIRQQRHSAQQYRKGVGRPLFSTPFGHFFDTF